MILNSLTAVMFVLKLMELLTVSWWIVFAPSIIWLLWIVFIGLCFVSVYKR